MEVTTLLYPRSDNVILNTKEGRKPGVSRYLVVKLTDEEVAFLIKTKGTTQHMKFLMAEQIFDELIEDLTKQNG